MRKIVWRVAFLGVTVLAVVMELFASFDGDSDTEPWTRLIVQYLPGEVAAFLIAGLTGWLGIHFGRRYLRKRKDGEDGRSN